MRQLMKLMEGVSMVPGLGETRELGRGQNDPELERLKQRAQENSKQGFVQHVNKDKRDGRLYISDWYDTDETVASYENGRELYNEGEAAMQTAGTATRGADYAAFDAAQGQATEESAWSTYNKHDVEESTDGSEVTDQQVKDAYQRSHEAFVNNAPNKHQLADYASMLANKYAQQESRKHHGRGFDPISGALHPEGDDAVDESVPAIKSCNQSNPADCAVACAMEEDMELNEVSDLMLKQQHARFSDLINSYVEPQEAFDVIQREMDEQGLEAHEQDEIMARLENDFFPDNSDFDQMGGPNDMSDDADALASAGHGSDEDYGGEDFPMEEAFNLQNGYDDVKFASGRDYFPDGADSPVVDATGPSGARQGDNPEQKKMQVKETHTELVYAYRNFLKESAVTHAPKDPVTGKIKMSKAGKAADTEQSDREYIAQKQKKAKDKAAKDKAAKK